MERSQSSLDTCSNMKVLRWQDQVIQLTRYIPFQVFAFLILAVVVAEPVYSKPSYPAASAPAYPKTEYVSGHLFIFNERD